MKRFSQYSPDFAELQEMCDQQDMSIEEACSGNALSIYCDCIRGILTEEERDQYLAGLPLCFSAIHEIPMNESDYMYNYLDMQHGRDKMYGRARLQEELEATERQAVDSGLTRFEQIEVERDTYETFGSPMEAHANYCLQQEAAAPGNLRYKCPF